MSNVHLLRKWKVVLARLMRTETTWRGIPLAEVDHRTYVTSVVMWAMVLHDLTQRCYDFGNFRDHVSWATLVCSTDVDTIATLSSDAVVLWREQTSASSPKRVQSFAGFKHLFGQDPALVGRFLSPMSSAITSFLNTGDVSAFASVYQALSFLTRLSLSQLPQQEELEEAYVSNEVKLSSQRLYSPLVDDVRRVITEWLSGYALDENNFRPKHGPGAVAELVGDRTIRSKSELLGSSQLIDYVFSHYADLDVSSYFPDNHAEPTSLTSGIVFVPKSAKTRRVISKEPATLQFLEQGVDYSLRQYFRNHRIISRHIDLDDQSCQRLRALEGSRTGGLATVDLSAASDSISYELVKAVFRDTKLLPFLMALRSRYAALPSGRVVAMRKFAPMGSALTFPIQSLLFAAIVECTFRYTDLTYGYLPREFGVYGDDIIVPDVIYDDVVASLRLLGFTTNDTKSYAHDYRFRESCGCDAFDGVDVTPMRISRNYSAARITSYSPQLLAGITSMANEAFCRGFRLLRLFLVDYLINEEGLAVLFSDDERYGLVSSTPSNYRLLQKENRDYQRTEYYADVVSSTTCKSSFLKKERRLGYVEYDPDPSRGEYLRYHEWLRSTCFRTGDPLDPAHRAEVAIGTSSVRLRKRWVDPRLSGFPLEPTVGSLA